MRKSTRSGEIGSGLMGSSIGRVLETDVRKHGNDRRLRKSRHRQRQVSFGDAELPEGVDNWDKTTFGKARAGTYHVGFGNTHFDVTIRKALLEGAYTSRSLHI